MAITTTAATPWKKYTQTPSTPKPVWYAPRSHAEPTPLPSPFSEISAQGMKCWHQPENHTTPLIYLTKTELKTIQIGLRMFITQYSAEYGLIMAASVVALIPVLIVFLSLQKYFVQGVASTGIKG